MKLFNLNVFLFQYSFINCTLDSKPIRDLLLEYKAEVVEEELVDDETDVSIHVYLSFVICWLYLHFSDMNV